jgi:hypothetical protein
LNVVIPCIPPMTVGEYTMPASAEGLDKGKKGRKREED